MIDETAVLGGIYITAILIILNICGLISISWWLAISPILIGLGAKVLEEILNDILKDGKNDQQ